MSDPQIEAADINDERQTLEITWDDRHQSVYPLKYLRENCPCAQCRTERQQEKDTAKNPFRILDSNRKAPSSGIADVQPVGRYGMRIGWKDGHDTGIYTFEYLREICPCQICTATRPEEQGPYVHGIYIPK